MAEHIQEILISAINKYENPEEKVVILLPNTIMENEMKAKSIIAKEGIKGWVNIVRYYNDENNEEFMVIDL